VRVLAISGWCPWPPKNGSRARAYHLLASIAARHELTLLSFHAADDDPEAARQELRRFCRHVEMVKGSPHGATGPLSWRGLLSQTPRSYRQTFSTTMASLVRRFVPQADAAIALEIGATLYLNDVTGCARLFEEAEPSVIRNRIDAARTPVGRLRAMATWHKTARYLRRSVARFDRTTVVSEPERRCLANAGADVERVAVVPNGVDGNNLQHVAAARQHRIVFNGALTYGPNLEAMRFFVADVLPLITRAHPTISLWITGEHGEAGREFAGRQDIVLTGHVDDIVPVVAASRVCVAPLLSGGGTRLKILEAMSVGTPVVATLKGAEGLDVTNGSDILMADDAEGLATAVCALLSNDTMAARVGQRGRALVASQYTWDRCGARLEDALQAAQKEFLRLHVPRGTA
jgi:glycosyltransferase involved in cell wall biosynthesis